MHQNFKELLGINMLLKGSMGKLPITHSNKHTHSRQGLISVHTSINSTNIYWASYYVSDTRTMLYGEYRDEDNSLYLKETYDPKNEIKHVHKCI